MSVTLGMELLPMLEQLVLVLEQTQPPVRQQQLIELLVVRHCLRMGSREAALMVADGIHKHVLQLIQREPVEG